MKTSQFSSGKDCLTAKVVFKLTCKVKRQEAKGKTERTHKNQRNYRKTVIVIKKVCCNYCAKMHRQLEA